MKMQLLKEQSDLTTNGTEDDLENLPFKQDLSWGNNDVIILVDTPMLDTCIKSRTEPYPKRTAKIYQFPDIKVLLDVADNINATNDLDTTENKLEDSKGGAPKMEAMPILSSYIKAAMAASVVEKLEDGTYYASISLCPGVWANENTKVEALVVLREVLEEWLVLKLMDRDSLPSFSGIELNKVVEECWDQ